MKFQHRDYWLPCFVLLAGLLSACGYYFPGSSTQAGNIWKDSVLRVTGVGVENNPQLIFLLRDRLKTRLGLRGQEPKVGSQEKKIILKVLLEPVVHSLVAEDRSGRADQYRVTARAQLFVEGRENMLNYPVIRGTASYYEPHISTSVYTTRKRAEAEALERLADSLVAILSSGFQP